MLRHRESGESSIDDICQILPSDFEAPCLGGPATCWVMMGSRLLVVTVLKKCECVASCTPTSNCR